jgi:nitrous oxide reductase accessory protein NosL
MKQILALVMVLGVLGGILAGCSKAEDANATAPVTTDKPAEKAPE